jgi:hypothetical protein
MNPDEEGNSRGFIIQGSDFVLKCLDEASEHYDLYLLKVVNKGKENQKYEFKIYGYGMTIETCMKKIIQYRVRKRKGVFKGDGDDGLVQYYKLWMEEKAKLLAVFDFTQEEWNKLSRLKKVKIEEVKKTKPVEAEIVDNKDD